MNNLLGKFSQNCPEKMQTKLIKDAKQTTKMQLEETTEILYTEHINDTQQDIMQYFRKGSFDATNRIYFYVLWAFIAVFAQMDLA